MSRRSGKSTTRSRHSSGTPEATRPGQTDSSGSSGAGTVTAENPGIRLPARAIRPVVREEGSGTTAAFTGWMSERQPERWDAYCQAHGRPAPCGGTLTFPVGGQVARAGSNLLAATVAQPGGDGMIGYVEYAYALARRLPVAKVRNQAGYYIAPTAGAVGVALSGAGQDRRAYPVSSYASLIVPTTTGAGFTEASGLTLSEFGRHALCRGQRDLDLLGFAPLPVNLVRPGLEQLQRIPGAVTRADPLAGCENPTFAADGTDTLPATAPQPPECDNQASGTQCVTASPAGCDHRRRAAGVGPCRVRRRRLRSRRGGRTGGARLRWAGRRGHPLRVGGGPQRGHVPLLRRPDPRRPRQHAAGDLRRDADPDAHLNYAAVRTSSTRSRGMPWVSCR
ncbi:substrate-binding domain-containing protein [Dactylosporangium sp. NPDC049742]|uniref:substrate-binding domain-containing protein n=1 Tax=Dactylosporangium sp. NPDC049742 TaxID=3154737 RepID=UPI003417255A